MCLEAFVNCCSNSAGSVAVFAWPKLFVTPWDLLILGESLVVFITKFYFLLSFLVWSAIGVSATLDLQADADAFWKLYELCIG